MVQTASSVCLGCAFFKKVRTQILKGESEVQMNYLRVMGRGGGGEATDATNACDFLNPSPEV